MMNLEKAPIVEKLDEKLLTIADKWILSRVNTLVAEVTEGLENYDLGISAQKVNDFIWEEFCDWYVEMVKPRLYSETDETKAAALWTLNYVLTTSLKLLHPYMPFVTEESSAHCRNDRTKGSRFHHDFQVARLQSVLRI
jgi:valyl-tRNA synthetase